MVFLKYRVLVFVLAFLASLTFNALAYGGLARMPEFGQRVMDAVRTDSPMTWLYMAIGNQLAERAGLEQAARSTAEAAFPASLPFMAETPNLASDLMARYRGGFTNRLLRFSYWLCPLLLLATLYAWWRRPRQVAVIRRR